jgi:hypothetical protein
MTEDITLKTLWEEAEPFPVFLERVESGRTLWDRAHRTATVPAWAVEVFGQLPGGSAAGAER